MERFGSEPANIVEPSILIKIEQEWKPDLSPEQLYERTRRYWVCAPRRGPRYALAVAKGIIREAYEIDSWPEDYPTGTKITPDPDRIQNKPFVCAKRRRAFIGNVALVMAHLKGRSVFHFQCKGALNPFQYVNCR